jgi:hypothetical protein
MSNLRRFLLPMLLPGAILILAIAFRSYFMAYFIRPVALMFWAAWRVLASVHQGVYWAILIFLCLVLTTRFLPPEGQLPPPAAYKYGRRRPSRVQYWLSLVRGGTATRVQRDVLRLAMRDLLTSMIARTGRSDLQDLYSLHESELAALSSGARSFILLDPHEKRGPGARFRRFWDRLRSTRREDEAAICEILSWMESRMEISDER